MAGVRAEAFTSYLRDCQEAVTQVGAARWAEWHRFEEFVEAGRVATRRFLGLPDPAH